MCVISKYCIDLFSGREKKSEGKIAGDTRRDPDRSEFNWLHSQFLREGKESLQFHCPLFELLGHNADDSRGRCPIFHPHQIPYLGLGRQ